MVKAKTIKQLLSGEYLYYFTLTKGFKRWVKVMSTRSGQPGISGKEYKSLLIPLPTRKEQEGIISILNSSSQLIERDRTNLNKLISLKNGLMQDLLTGKVRVDALMKQTAELV